MTLIYPPPTRNSILAIFQLLLNWSWPNFKGRFWDQKYKYISIVAYMHTCVLIYRHTLHACIIEYLSILLYLHTWGLVYFNNFNLAYLHTIILAFLHTILLHHLYTCKLAYLHVFIFALYLRPIFIQKKCLQWLGNWIYIKNSRSCSIPQDRIVSILLDFFLVSQGGGITRLTGLVPLHFLLGFYTTLFRAIRTCYSYR